MTPEHRMPVLFIGHGNLMNDIEETPFAEAWWETSSAIPRPNSLNLYKGRPMASGLLLWRSLGRP